MSSTPGTWLRRLDSDRKGIWTILCPMGSSFTAEHNEMTAPRGVELAVIDVTTGPDGIAFRHGETLRTANDFSEIVAFCSRAAEESGRGSIRVVIDHFHLAPLHDQCTLIKKARAIQETSSAIAYQFVFCGRWSYYAFRLAYRDIYGHTISPPAQSKDILHVPAWRSDDVLRTLTEKALSSSYPSALDRVAAEFLVEHTAGDEFLIGRTVARLAELGEVGELRGTWTTMLEQVLDELAEAPEVVDGIAMRISSLDAPARLELAKILQVQRLVRPVDSITSEQLWLAGLVQRRDLGDGKSCIHIAGPLIDTVVRRVLHREDSIRVVPPELLCFDRGAISAVAYRKIADIEGVLRNLVVTQWYAALGDKWFQPLEEIRTLSPDEEEKGEVAELVATLVRSHLTASGLSVPEAALPEKTEDRPRRARSQESLLQSAEDWRKRQRDHHAVDLASDNLMQFLTTEALMSVLVNKRNGLHGEGRPFKREYLITALEEYIVIRGAVAHNQALKLSTLMRIDDLYRKLLEWLTVFVDQE